MKTFYDVMFNSLKGKHFHNTLQPSLIIQDLNSVKPKMIRNSGSIFSGRCPTLKKQELL